MSSQVCQLDHKASLLPLKYDQQGSYQNIHCQHEAETASYKKKYKFQTFAFTLFLILFVLYNGHYSFSYGKYSEVSSQDCTSNCFQDIGNVNIVPPANNSEQMKQVGSLSGLSNYYCGRVKPRIPFTGLSKWKFDAEKFERLLVGQKTNGRFERSISFESGTANVYVDNSVSTATVDFNLKLSRDELQDVIYVEDEFDEETKSVSFILKAEETHLSGCVSLDIIVRVPNADDLSYLTISLPNSAVNFHGGLNLTEKLVVSVANGHLSLSEENDGISFRAADIHLANGHVSGNINSLGDALGISLANGHASVVIKDIDQSEDKANSIKISLANGHADLTVPNNFESKYQLTSASGKRIVEASNPKNIHNTGSNGRWTKSTTGYYGDNADSINSIVLSAANGKLKLTYA